MREPQSQPAAASAECDEEILPSHHTEDAQFLREVCASDDREEIHRQVKDRTATSLERTGRGLNLGEADLRGCDLSGLDLRRANLNRAILWGVRLANADLSGASLVCAGLERTNFVGATLRGAYLHALAAQASDFRGADMRELVDATGSLFHGCNLAGARLSLSQLAGAGFYQCDLQGAALAGADLHGAFFNECRLDGADFSSSLVDDVSILRSRVGGLVLHRARGRGLSIQRPTGADRMSLDAAHLPSLRLTGVQAAEVSARGLYAPGLDVEGGDLSGVNFSGADLRDSRWARTSINEARLDGASLQDSVWIGVTARGLQASDLLAEGFTATQSILTDAVLARFRGRYAALRNCQLDRVDLRGSYLYRASIIGDPPTSAGLVGARLEGSNLTQAYVAADLTDADFSQGWATYARVNQSVFSGADLRGTGLYQVGAVKADFTGTKLGGQDGALLADRCPGLVRALRESDDPRTREMADEVERLAELLASISGKST